VNAVQRTYHVNNDQQKAREIVIEIESGQFTQDASTPTL
jgi:hypothetical protein